MLSERELEVLKLMAEGKTNEEISKELWLHLGTTKKHVHSILKKLEVNNRTNAVIYYLKNMMPIETTYVFVDWRDHHSERLAELHREGYKVSSLAKIMNLPETVIRQKLKSLGLIL